MNAQRTVFGDVGDIVFDLVKEKSFVCILASACGNKMNSFLGQRPDKFDCPGRQLLRFVFEAECRLKSLAINLIIGQSLHKVIEKL